MSNINNINRIYIDSPVTITPVDMTSLLFIDGKYVCKDNYSILDNQLNLTANALESVILYQKVGDTKYYEFNIPLKTSGIVLSGKDKYGNELEDFTDKTLIIFINGYKLSPNEFTVSGSEITLNFAYPEQERSDICIQSTQSLVYVGQAVEQPKWSQKNRSFQCLDYSYNRYLIFNNGELIPNQNINYDNKILQINMELRDTDIVEIYKYTSGISCLTFNAANGYYTYGPEDARGIKIVNMYNALASFNSVTRLLIDDLRYGFFIHEIDGDGLAMIVDEEYESTKLKCLILKPFSKTVSYSSDEYFLCVPEARSILNYVSEYDLHGILFKEILGAFQTILLNETYDSLQRLGNIRNLNKVDQANVAKLIAFLGLDINTNNMSTMRKHAILEQLNGFYETVGTRQSYNFYNAMNLSSRIMDIKQLFTPKKNIQDGIDISYRYVTFKTAADLGAVVHTEFILPQLDYGYVYDLANRKDVAGNEPHDQGIVQDPTKPISVTNTRKVWVMGDDGEIVTKLLPMTVNTFTKSPIAGPNTATIDYGYVLNDPENIYDYGYVYEKVKGHWIEWTEWEKPEDWYATNHVEVSVEIPPDVSYDNFINEFKRTFYDIASAVVYIHTIIEVYSFGRKKKQEGEEDSDNRTGAGFNILEVPYYQTSEYTFTNDPNIQPTIQ